jgi:predicted nucleic acid-binding protein
VILVDTSVWIDHLRRGDAALSRALEEGEVITHSFVVGELACGNIVNRSRVMGMLAELPRAREAQHDEVLAMVEGRRLMGLGLGYVDMHLLAASALTPSAKLWTRDKRLAQAARRLGLGR